MMDMTGYIFDIKRFALYDGPGIRTTIFLKGCPLHCLWCHNPEGISPSPVLVHYETRCIRCNACLENCPKQAISLINHVLSRGNSCDLCGRCVQTCTSNAWEFIGTRKDCQDILDIIHKDTVFFEESCGGITFSGGEPLYQIDFLEECLRLIKIENYHIAVDTSGYAQFCDYQRIIPFTDLLLYDIKIIDEQKHIHNTGVSNKLILSNFSKLASTSINMIVRIPVIPGINDDSEEIHAIGQFVKENSSIDRIDLLPYHHMADEKYKRLNLNYKLPNILDLSYDEIEPLRKVLIDMGFISVTGG